VLDLASSVVAITASIAVKPVEKATISNSSLKCFKKSQRGDY